MNLPEPTLHDLLTGQHTILKAIQENYAKQERRFDEVFEVIRALSTHLDQQINSLRSELKSEFTSGLSMTKSELKSDLARIEKKIDKHTLEIGSLHIRVARLETI